MIKRVFVVGCGSIGQRHMRNLRALDVKGVLTYDTNQERLQRVSHDLAVQPCRSVEEGLDQRPEAVLVCTPPHTHLPLATKALEHGCHVFVEKPLSHSLDGVDEFLIYAAERDRLVCVGYNLRFHPGLSRLKQMLGKGVVGTPLYVFAEFGQYLPDWRPSQDYRDSYTAHGSMGGGIILDASHELDHVRWWAGDVERLYCVAAKVSDLQMDAEDTAEISMRLRNGVLAHIHLDCIQRNYTRHCKVIGSHGTIRWDSQDGLFYFDATRKSWHSEPIVWDPNSMYLSELKHFFKCIAGDEDLLVDGKEGKSTLALALAAKRSALEHREILL